MKIKSFLLIGALVANGLWMTGCSGEKKTPVQDSPDTSVTQSQSQSQSQSEPKEEVQKGEMHAGGVPGGADAEAKPQEMEKMHEAPPEEKASNESFDTATPGGEQPEEELVIY